MMNYKKKYNGWKILATSLLLLNSLTSNAAEEIPFSSEFNIKIGTSNITALKVLREICPDLTSEGKYTQMKGRRQEIQTMDVSGDGGMASEGEGALDGFEGLTFSSQGKSYAVILALPNDILLLAQIYPEYRFLDAIDVGQDIHANLSREVGFLDLGAGLTGFGIISWHTNAGEEYQNYLMVGVLGEKFRALYDGPFLYNFVEPTGSDRVCRNEQRLEKPLPACKKNEEHCEIKLAVIARRLCGPNLDEEKVISSRRFSATLHWDPTRKNYQGGMKDLFSLNRKRIGL